MKDLIRFISFWLGVTGNAALWAIFFATVGFYLVCGAAIAGSIS